MLTKQQKQQFVEKHAEELKHYSTIGIIKTDGLPDRLLQSSKNRLKSGTKFIMGRKSLLIKILEKDTNNSKLIDQISGTCAIIATNADPFELYAKFKANSIRLAAKPKQISPEDITIQAGETTLQPGQVVTELKSAGIDVQIQKGKVVIGKDKVLVKRGERITVQVAKALRIMDIMPFNASIAPAVLFSNGLFYNTDVLSITKEGLIDEMMHTFNAGLALSLKAKIINRYTIARMISTAFSNSMVVGVKAQVPDKGIAEKLLELAAAQAQALNSLAPS